MATREADAYDDAIAAMYNRVDEAIEIAAVSTSGKFLNTLTHGTKNAVIYSVYECEDDSDDGEGLPIDNLDDIAFKGTFRVKGNYHEFYDGSGEGETYVSDPITDPTWLQLCVLANDSINTTRDYHHAFFEGANREGKYLSLAFGS